MKKPLDMIFKGLTLNPESIYKKARLRKLNEVNGQEELTTFFKIKKQETSMPAFEYIPELTEEVDDDDISVISMSEISEDLFTGMFE